MHEPLDSMFGSESQARGLVSAFRVGPCDFQSRRSTTYLVRPVRARESDVVRPGRATCARRNRMAQITAAI